MKLRKYKLYYSLSLASELLLKWGWLPIAWHLVYFLINISERISPQAELFLLWLYPSFLAVFLAVFSLKAWRTFKDFDRKMENTFSLNFEWINFKHALKERNNAFSYRDFNRILEACSMRPFFSKAHPLRIGRWTLASLGLVFALHLGLYNLSNRFVLNLKSIVSPPSVAVDVHHPDFVKEGDSFPIRFTGDLPEGRLVLTSGERVIDEVVGNDTLITLTNITAKIDGELRFKEGRFSITKPIKPAFAAKPNLQSLSISIRDPIMQKWTTHEGILELSVYDHSQGKLSAAIQPSQAIKAVFLNDKKMPASSISENAFSTSFATPVKSTWQLRFVNEHDLASKPITITFNRMTNEKPLIYFVGVEAEKFLASNQKGYVGYIAQDDISIKRTVLFMSVHSPQEEGSLDSEQVELFRNNKKQHIRQVELEHHISLKNLDMRQDTFVRYYVMVEDFYGLKATTSTNIWKQKNLIEKLDSKDKLLRDVDDKLSEKLEQIKDLIEEKKDLDLIKEQGELTDERVKSYESNVAAAKEELAKLSEELEELASEEKLDEDLAINEKLEELLEEIMDLEQSLDLSKNEDPEDNKGDQNEEFDLEELAEKLEKYKDQLEQLKQESERENLDVISEKAYQIYQDMLLKKSIDLLTPKSFSNSKAEIANLLKELEARFDSFKEFYTPPDEEAKGILDNIEALMNSNLSQKVSDLEKENLNPSFGKKGEVLKPGEQQPNQQQQNQQQQAQQNQGQQQQNQQQPDDQQGSESLSNQLNSLRTNYRDLARRQMMADFEAIYSAIYEQVNGLLAQNKTIRNLSNAHTVDAGAANAARRVKELSSLFLLDYESLTKDYKYTMDELLKGFFKNILSLLELYDDQIVLIASLKTNPSSTRGASLFGRLTESSKTISGRLLDIYEHAVEQQKLMELQQAQGSAMSGQQQMGNQLSRMPKPGNSPGNGGPGPQGKGEQGSPGADKKPGQAAGKQSFSQSQKEYLRQLARQQAQRRQELQKRMDALGEGQPGGDQLSSSQQGEGKPGQGKDGKPGQGKDGKPMQGENGKPMPGEGEAGSKPGQGKEPGGGGAGPKERGGQLSQEALEALNQATRLMKQIEDELNKAVTHGDLESAKNAEKLNREVIDNLLRGKMGNLRKKKKDEEEKDDERKAQREQKDYKGTLTPIDKEATAYKRKTIQMQKIRSIPSHYKKRLDFIYDEIYNKQEENK